MKTHKMRITAAEAEIIRKKYPGNVRHIAETITRSRMEEIRAILRENEKSQAEKRRSA